MALMGKYIYCFIKEKESVTFGSSDIGNLNAPVYTISYDDISAVVSDAPKIDYDPTRKNILSHQNVIVRVMEKHTVIPVAFGTVGDNKKDIKDIIRANYNKFYNLIDYFKDRIELGVRVTWDNDYFNEDIENDRIKELKYKIVGKDENEVLPEKIELGKLVEKAVLSKKDEYVNLMYKPLSKIAVESKLKENIPIKTVFSGYFLVEKQEEKEFDKAVEEFDRLYKGKLVINYTGPWPPYNFVSMSINLNYNDKG